MNKHVAKKMWLTILWLTRDFGRQHPQAVLQKFSLKSLYVLYWACSSPQSDVIDCGWFPVCCLKYYSYHAHRGWGIRRDCTIYISVIA